MRNCKWDCIKEFNLLRGKIAFFFCFHLLKFIRRLNTIRKLPQYTVERLESGGHHVHIAKPEVCAAPINKFLK